jgi:methyl-accepting chemotaxis protein
MIYRLQIAETLDDFWRNHSVPDDLRHQSNTSFPVTIVDDSLAQAINIVITQLGDLGALASENSHSSDITGLSRDELWSGAISSINRLIKTRDALAAERDALAAERDALAAERDALAAERDALAAERDALAAERDALAAEIDRLEVRRTAAESVVDVHRQEISKLTSSKAFRLGMFITWPARHLRSAIAALKRRA